MCIYTRSFFICTIFMYILFAFNAIHVCPLPFGIISMAFSVSFCISLCFIVPLLSPF